MDRQPPESTRTYTLYPSMTLFRSRNRELIDSIVKGPVDKGSDQARIANFYKAYIDTKAIDAAGIQPVQADLARFDAIADKAALSKVLGEQVRADVDPLNATDYRTENLFGIFVTQGLATPGEVLPYMLQGGLGLPEREYYLSSDPKMAGIRDDYKAYLAKLLTAAGIADADAKAARAHALAMKIASSDERRVGNGGGHPCRPWW